MGVLNVTPDSFSDGGLHDDPASAVAWGERLIAEGAAILDVGGESTRPGSRPITAADQLARVRPVVTRFASADDVPVSIDTRDASVAQACVEAGAAIINDISGFRSRAMVEVAAGCEAGVIVMHMLGEPGTMQSDPRYNDVVRRLATELGPFRATAASSSLVPHSAWQGGRSGREGEGPSGHPAEPHSAKPDASQLRGVPTGPVALPKCLSAEVTNWKRH